MSFIAKNPLIMPEIESPTFVPRSGTRGLFAGEDGWYDINSENVAKKLITINDVNDEFDKLTNTLTDTIISANDVFTVVGRVKNEGGGLSTNSNYKRSNPIRVSAGDVFDYCLLSYYNAPIIAWYGDSNSTKTYDGRYSVFQPADSQEVQSSTYTVKKDGYLIVSNDISNKHPKFHQNNAIGRAGYNTDGVAIRVDELNEELELFRQVDSRVGNFDYFFKNGTKGMLSVLLSDTNQYEFLDDGDYITSSFIRVYAGDVLHYSLLGDKNSKGRTSSLLTIYDTNKNETGYVRAKVNGNATTDKYEFIEDGYVRLCNKSAYAGKAYFEHSIEKQISGSFVNIAVFSDSIFSLSGGAATDAIKNKTTILDYLQKKINCNYFNFAVGGTTAYGREDHPLDFSWLINAIQDKDFTNQISALGRLEANNNGVVVNDVMKFYVKTSEHTKTGIITYEFRWYDEDKAWTIINDRSFPTLKTQSLKEFGLSLKDESIVKFEITRSLNYPSYVPVHIQTLIDLYNGTNISGKNSDNKTFADIDILIINYGTNDYLNGKTLDDVKKSLRNGIDVLLSKYPNMKIIINSPYYHFSPSQSTDADEKNKGIITFSRDITVVTISDSEFMSKCGALNGNVSHDKFEFKYNGTNWIFNNTEIDISEYGVTIEATTLSAGSWFTIEWVQKDCMNTIYKTRTIKDYINAEKEVAEEYNLAFFDNLTSFGWNNYNKINYFYRNDGLHPRETGAQYMANALYENMKHKGYI